MPTPEARAKERRRNNRLQMLAFICIVLIGAFGFYQQEHQDELRCEEGVELRNVLRGQVEAIYNLGRQAATPPLDKEGNPIPRSPQEQQQVKQYLQNLKDYRDRQLSKITPSKACDIAEDPELKSLALSNQTFVLWLTEQQNRYLAPSARNANLAEPLTDTVG